MNTVHAITSYEIGEHPNRDAVYDWIRSNWHDLGEYYIDDAINSLKEFASFYDADPDWCIGIFPDRGEYIRFSLSDDAGELSGVRLWKYLENNYSEYASKYTGKRGKTLDGNCPFSGMLYDEILLDEIRGFMKKPDSRTFNELLDDCGHKLLTAIHEDVEYIYSDAGLFDLCQANEYEFTENGAIFE